MISEGYERGRCATFDGIGKDSNPYPPGTRDAERWLEGWQDGISELGLDSGPICSICARPLVGHGHNADPVAEGRCCDECNVSVVLPARHKGITGADN